MLCFVTLSRSQPAQIHLDLPSLPLLFCLQLKGEFTSQVAKEAGRCRYTGGCMHNEDNMLQTQKLQQCRYLSSDKNLKKQKHKSFHFGAPNAVCASQVEGTSSPFQYFSEE